MKAVSRALFCLLVLGLVSAAPAQRKSISATDHVSPVGVTAPVPTPTDGPRSILLQEDFSTASGSTPPSGWSNAILEGVPTDVWRFDNPANRAVAINQTAPVAVFDSDFLSCGTGSGPENVALVSPAFNAPLNSVITLTFRQYFRSNNTDGLGAIVELFNGLQWVIVDSAKYSTPDPDTLALDITTQVAGVSNARIRFRFKGNCSWYWYVDDVMITETSIAPSTRLLLETFKTGNVSTPPAGWTNNRMVGQSYDEWRFDNPGGRDIRLPMTGLAAIFDSDSLSRLGGAEDVALESPAFNAAANSTVMLSIDHFFRGDSGGRGTVEIFNGASWVAIWDSTHSTPNPQTLSLDISSHVAGVANARVRFRWRGWWSWWWLVDNVVITETPGSPPSGAFASDQFNDPSLNTAVWTFINPRSDASYSMTGTQLSISMPAGTSHDITESGNFAPRVMQDVANPQSFSVYVKFDGLMNQAYQMQGIQVWEDSLNYLRLEFYGDGTSLSRLAWDFVNGLHQDHGSAGLGIPPTTPLYMKLTRLADVWTQYWSTDGVTYNVGAAFTRAMNVTKIGVYAANVGFPESSTPAFTGMFDYFMSSDPLPVQIGSFVGYVSSQGRVQLNWTTVTETNNYGFEVQKSANATSGFVTCPNSFVAGNGTTIEPHTYSWVDPQTTAGRWYYRLKQIDLDQTIHYSEPIQVDVLTSAGEAKPKVFALHQNYPNPFNPSTEIGYQTLEFGRVTLKVFDILGREVATLVNDAKEQGKYSIHWSAEGFPSGVYFYRLTSGTRSDMKRMILVK
ncbi:MAG: T9SS type A sorting domain-containing protein [Ignavibacteriae bacterium]|nr:T9SS type A sorting domain-containing protein [Ignavibacteriota bacterium]